MKDRRRPLRSVMWLAVLGLLGGCTAVEPGGCKDTPAGCSAPDLGAPTPDMDIGTADFSTAADGADLPMAISTRHRRHKQHPVRHPF